MRTGSDEDLELSRRMRELAAMRIGDTVLFKLQDERVLPAIVTAVHEGELVDLEVFGVPFESPDRRQLKVPEGTAPGCWKFHR